MVACLESLSLVSASDIIRDVASLVLEVSEGDKDGEFSEKCNISLSSTRMQPMRLTGLSSSPLQIAHELSLHGLR
jgi:hypothetical protein